MALTEKYLNQLIADKTALANNLTTKGVEASSEETFTELVPKVLDIPSGGSEITKGVIVNEVDSNGYATDISIVGMTSIPNYYLTGNMNGTTFYSNASTVTIPEGTTKIGSSVFTYFTKLKTVNLPTTITSLGNYAFSSCGFETFTIPSVIKDVPEGLLSNCKSLISVDIPEDATSLSNSVFQYCENLILTELPSTLISLGASTFSNAKKITLKSLPSGITSLNSMLFLNCLALTEMTCNGAITSMNTSIFMNCSNLLKFALPNVTSVPTLSSWNAFQNTPIASGTGYIYVPDDLVESFKTASNWSTYAAQIKGISELPTE